MSTSVDVVSISWRLWIIFAFLILMATLIPGFVALERTRSNNQVMLQWASMLTKVHAKQRALEATERQLEDRTAQREKDLAQLQAQIQALRAFIRSVRAR